MRADVSRRARAQRRRRQLPAAGAALAAVALLATSVTGGTGAPSSLRTLPADAPGTTITTAVGDDQAGAEVSLGYDESNPTDGHSRDGHLSVGGRSAGVTVNKAYPLPSEPEEGQLVSDPSGDAVGAHSGACTVDTCTESDPWFQRSEPSTDVLSSTLVVDGDSLVATIDVVDLSSDIRANQTTDGVAPYEVWHEVSFRLGDRNGDDLSLFAMRTLDDGTWSFEIWASNPVSKRATVTGSTSFEDNRITISAPLAAVNDLLGRSAEDGVGPGSTLHAIWVSTEGRIGQPDVLNSGRTIDHASRPNGSSYRL